MQKRMEILLGMKIGKNKNAENMIRLAFSVNRVENRDGGEPKIPWYIISHNNKIKKVFDTIVLILVGYSMCINTNYAAFGPPDNTGLIVFDWIVESLFVLSLILSFITAFKDQDTGVVVVDIKKISYKYLTGWFLIDFLSVFPFYLFVPSYGYLIKLFRILRMPKLMSFIDVKKTKRIINSFFENASRVEKVLVNHLVINSYKIIRLIVLAAIITYFFGCFWYIISDNIYDSSSDRTFVKYFNLNRDEFRSLIIS